MNNQARYLKRSLEKQDQNGIHISPEAYRIGSSGTAINPENIESARIMSQNSIESTQNLHKIHDYEVHVTLKGTA